MRNSVSEDSSTLLLHFYSTFTPRLLHGNSSNVCDIYSVLSIHFNNKNWSCSCSRSSDEYVFYVHHGLNKFFLTKNTQYKFVVELVLRGRRRQMNLFSSICILQVRVSFSPPIAFRRGPSQRNLDNFLANFCNISSFLQQIFITFFIQQSPSSLSLSHVHKVNESVLREEQMTGASSQSFLSSIESKGKLSSSFRRIIHFIKKNISSLQTKKIILKI